MSVPIGVALIGSGIFAKTEHLPAILSNPSLTLEAVFSRTLASASTFTSSITRKIDWYTDETAAQGRGYTDLLSNPNIKAVVIALPILVQPAFIKEALAAGKHVLSEKPVAKDMQVGRELAEWWVGQRERGAKGSWSVGENFRCLESHECARRKIAELGRLLGFRVRVQNLVKPGGKYYETTWRKEPEYQGGFLLDGGIHYIAAMRYMLGPANAITRISAFSQQLQKHLPPVDTVDAIIQTKTGASGTFSVSFGTTFKGSDYSIACENGTVTVLRSKVVVEKDGVEETFDFPDEGAGVKQESLAWTKGVESGEFDPRLSPAEALADLAVLEAMLRSGESNGKLFEIQA